MNCGPSGVTFLYIKTRYRIARAVGSLLDIPQFREIYKIANMLVIFNVQCPCRDSDGDRDKDKGEIYVCIYRERDIPRYRERHS
jgi:hypothetical protein